MRKLGLDVFGILDSPFFPLIQLLLELGCFQMSPRSKSTCISMEHGYPKKTTIQVLEILDTSILASREQLVFLDKGKQKQNQNEKTEQNILYDTQIYKILSWKHCCSLCCI